jgi:hypothetical protein
MNTRNQNRFLSPLSGLGWFLTSFYLTSFYPRLAPWANICRRSAASDTHRLIK